MHQTPVSFFSLFKYATFKDLLLISIGNIFILYSSFNIPLVNIVYGMMMRDMNDFVANRSKILSEEQFFGQTTPLNKLLDHQNTNTNLQQSASLVSNELYDNSSSNINHSVYMSLAGSKNNDTLERIEVNFMDNAFRLCLIVIIFGATRFFALYIALLSYSVAATNQAKRVKLLFFRSLLRQEVAWFDLNRTGDFAIRITSDLSKFEDGIGEKIALCLNALFAWITSIMSSFYYGWELTLVCLVLVPFTIIIATIIAEFQASYSLKETSALSHAFNVCHEVISSIRTVLAFSGQQKEANRFDEKLKKAYNHGLKRNVYAGLNLGFTWMSGYLGFAICLLYSTKFYKPENFGSYDEAHIITILWSAAGCVFLLNRMMPFIEVIQMARGSASNLFAVIERKSLIDSNSKDGLKLDYYYADVEFKDVCFTYPASPAEPQQKSTQILTKNQNIDDEGRRKPSLEEQTSSAATASTSLDSTASSSNQEQLKTVAPQIVVTDLDAVDLTANNDSHTSESSDKSCQTQSSLMSSNIGLPSGTIKNMCLEVKSGQTIALVGPSGSGKSTALALLQRFYELNSGCITLGGHDISKLNLGWLREQFGVVTQEPVLFDMSIADNIRLGALPHQSVSDYDIEEAAKCANAHSFIVALPDGYQTRAGARGVQLSGGQKQRIAIARALIRQPKILLLDEATSALDLESESIVQRALDKARVGRTTFIVAHRLSTVRNSDKIIVFDKGTVVEVGTHEELVKKRGLYYQINAQQKRGIDLIPNARRDSLIGPSSGICGGAVVGGGGGGVIGVTGRNMAGKSDKMIEYTRESRSMSIYSTGKFAAAGGLGATGHGGNGEGVDSTAGSCAPDVKFNDDEYYNRNLDDEESESDSDDEQIQFAIMSSDNASIDNLIEAPEGSSASNTQTIQNGQQSLTKPRSSSVLSARRNIGLQSKLGQTLAAKSGLRVTAGDDPQSSLLDMESAAFINSRGRKVTHLSLVSILKFINPNIPFSITGIFTSLMMGFCIPISAMIIGDIATIFATDNPLEIRSGLYTHGLLYISLAIFAFLVSLIQVISFGIASEKIGASLRLRGLSAILARDISWFDSKRNNPGSICARLASDVGNVQSITGNRTAVIFQSISILIFTFAFAVYYNLKFSSVCVAFVAILLLSTVMQARYAGKLALTNRNFDSQIGKIVLESSANIKTVVSLHQEEYFVQRCESLLNSDNRCWSKNNHMRLLLESLKYAMTAISKGSSFYFAARMLVNNEIQVDDIFKLIEIILYGLTEASKSLIFISDLEKARRGTQNLYKLVNNNHKQQLDSIGANLGFNAKKSFRNKQHHSDYLPRFLNRNLISAPRKYLRTSQQYKRLKDDNDQSNACPTIVSPDRFEKLKVEGNIKFDSVRFCYPSRPDACVLKSLSLEIPAGKSVALVGRSGCGKSTIVQLLQKFYDSFQGEIKVDGLDIRQVPTEWIRKQIALVSQEPSLFSYSIEENIRYGDNSRFVSFDEVVQAAQTANIHDFIMSLPNGYNTVLSESNSLQLSGGQKQRIAIARALIRNAPIMIFDEATSALDSKSEHVVQEALQKAQVGRTSIIVAHRLSAIKDVDCVIVLKDGIVVEQGSHEDLIEKRGEYYRLYKSQSNKM